MMFKKIMCSTMIASMLCVSSANAMQELGKHKRAIILATSILTSAVLSYGIDSELGKKFQKHFNITPGETHIITGLEGAFASLQLYGGNNDTMTRWQIALPVIGVLYKLISSSKMHAIMHHIPYFGQYLCPKDYVEANEAKYTKYTAALNLLKGKTDAEITAALNLLNGKTEKDITEAYNALKGKKEEEIKGNNDLTAAQNLIAAQKLVATQNSVNDYRHSKLSGFVTTLGVFTLGFNLLPIVYNIINGHFGTTL